MDNLDDLKSRIERVNTELRDIKELFEKEIADPQKSVSFKQVKEIEGSIERFRRQGLPVPEELKQLKLRLFSNYETHKEIISLYNKFRDSIHSLKLSEIAQITPKPAVGPPKTIGPPYRKPPDYERPLGARGNSNVEDYLIPVIKLMWNGYDHKEAFRRIASNLDVRYNTVSSQCTRGLGLNTDEFISMVKSKAIVDLIETKYPDQYQIIKSQLKR